MKCFYHSADLDGHCSGAIVKRRHPACELIGWNYGDAIPEIAEHETVFLVDVSFPVEVMLDLARKGVRVEWIDHHVSAIRAYEQRLEHGGISLHGHLSTQRAGCELTWEYLFPDLDMPLGVRLLGIYDSWRWKTPAEEELVLAWQYGMRLISETRPESAMAMWAGFFEADRLSLFYEKTMERGRICHQYQCSENAKIIERAAFETMLPYGPDGHLYAVKPLRCIAVNYVVANSKVFDSAYDPERHDAMLIFYWSNAGGWRCSVYSAKESVDASVFAKSYGGGGHKGAAGFRCDALPFVLSAKGNA